jgi:hypothetical protein
VRAGERRDEPRHVWLVPDQHQRAVLACRRDQLGGVIGAEVAAERLVHDRLDAELGAGNPGRIEARTRGLVNTCSKRTPSRASARPAARDCRSPRSVSGDRNPAGAVSLGVTVAQQPKRFRHDLRL